MANNSQLQEYLQQYEAYKQKQLEYKKMMEDNDLPLAMRKDAKKKFNLYHDILGDLSVQIQHLDPSWGKSNFRSYKEGTNVNTHLDSMGEHKSIEVGNYSMDEIVDEEYTSKLSKFYNEALQLITEKEAKVIYYRDQKGYSYRKICEELGYKCKNKQDVGIGKFFYNSAKTHIALWVKIRLLVDECDKDDNFDWDKFIDSEIVIIPPRGKEILLVLLDSDKNEYTSINQLSYFFKLSSTTITASLQRSAQIFKAIGVKKKYLHPFFAKYYDIPYKGKVSIISRIMRLQSRENYISDRNTALRENRKFNQNIKYYDNYGDKVDADS